MEHSENFNFSLPSRDTDDIVDINAISDNFRIIDGKLFDLDSETADQTYDPTSANAQSGKAVAKALSGYVVAEVGKGLSSNDFTNEDKEKLYSALQKENIDQTYTPESENAQSGKAVAEAVAIEQKRTDNTFANALKGSKSGAAFLIDDISPVTHEMRVKISSDTVTDLTAVKVTKCGKNLFDISSSRGFESAYGGLNNTINGNTLEIVCTVTARTGYLELGTFPKGTYTFSCNKSFEDLSQRIMIGNDILNLKELGSNFLTNTKTFTLSNESKVWVRNSGFFNGASPFIYSNIQLELNSTATDYEPYNSKTDYTPNADGTVDGVTSLYPNTTLLTDTDGVIIDCEYNRDINKAFAELQQTIISLGGNI